MAIEFHPTGDRIEIPRAFADYLGEVYGMDPPTTVWDWWLIEGQRSANNSGMTAADFYGDAPTRHEVHVNGVVQYAGCVLDALAGAAMASSLAVVRSADPVTDTGVMVAFSDEFVAVSPAEAVVSIGGRQTPEVALESHVSVVDYASEEQAETYLENFCRYRNAFESEDTYARWAADTDAMTFPASAEKLADLLHVLHRSSRFEFLTGLLVAGLRERLAEWRSR